MDDVAGAGHEREQPIGLGFRRSGVSVGSHR
jgi:hypothetical protein